MPSNKQEMISLLLTPSKVGNSLLAANNTILSALAAES